MLQQDIRDMHQNTPVLIKSCYFDCDIGAVRSEFSLVVKPDVLNYPFMPNVEGKVTSYFEVPSLNGKISEKGEGDVFTRKRELALGRIKFFSKFLAIPHLFYLRNGLQEGKAIDDLVLHGKKVDGEIKHGFSFGYRDVRYGEVCGEMETSRENVEELIVEYLLMLDFHLVRKCFPFFHQEREYKQKLHDPFVEELSKFFTRERIEQKLL